MRIIIAGGPKCGKSTLAEKLAKEMGMQTGERDGVGIYSIGLKHTDDLMDMEWSQASEVASYWFDEPGPWIIEGVTSARALRKWLERNPTGKPCDVLYHLIEPFLALSPGQETMLKGCKTVFAEIKSELENRGVIIKGFV